MSAIQRYLKSFRQQDDLEVGLFEKNDGTQWIRNPDGSETQIGSGGSQPWNVVPVTGPAEVTAAAGDLLVIDAGDDDVSVHLPASPMAGDQVGVWLSTSPDSDVGIDTIDGLTIDGQASVSLSNAYDVLIVVFGGDTDWAVLDQAGVTSLATQTGNVLPNGLINGDNFDLGPGSLDASAVRAAIDTSDPNQTLASFGPLDGAYWQVDGTGFEVFGPIVSPPADADIPNATRKQFYDATEDAPALRFKQRDLGNNLTSGKGASMNDDGTAFLGVNKPTVDAADGPSILAALVTLGLVIDGT